MSRLLVLLLIALIVAYWVDRHLGHLLERGGRRTAAPRRSVGGEAAAKADALVPCRRCGVHVPLSRTVSSTTTATSPSARYCSAECRTQAASGQG